MRVQLTMEELLRRWEYAKKVRNKCRRSLTYLCKYVLGYTDVHWEVDGDVHEDIMQNLQKFPYMAEDVLDKHGQCTVIPNKPLWELDTVIPGLSTRRTLTLYPRGHLKTSIITIAHTIQWIINYPNIRILISTATGDQCTLETMNMLRMPAAAATGMTRMENLRHGLAPAGSVSRCNDRLTRLRSITRAGWKSAMASTRPA